MKIFGGVIPFLGVRTLKCNNEGYPLPDQHSLYWRYECEGFEFEWFYVGMTFVVWNIRKVK